MDGVIGDLYDGALDARAWSRGLARIAGLVRAETTLLLSINPKSRTVRRVELHSDSLDQRVANAYFNDWLAEDIRVQPSLRMPLLEPFTEAQSVGHRIWKNSAIFNEFLSGNDVCWTLHGQLHRDAERASSISIQGGRSRGPFNADDARTIRPLLPHLRRALEIKDELERTAIARNALGSCLDSLDLAVVLLDDRQHIVECSQAAARYFTAGSGITRDREGRLCLREPAGGALSRWLATGIPPACCRDGVLTLPRESERSLLIAAYRLPLERTLWNGQGLPCWMLVISDALRKPSVSADIVAAVLGLTRREAEVAVQLYNGLGLNDLARVLNISVHTARTQLKSIYQKTGLKSQSQLVGEVSRTASAIPRPPG